MTEGYYRLSCATSRVAQLQRDGYWSASWRRAIIDNLWCYVVEWNK